MSSPSQHLAQPGLPDPGGMPPDVPVGVVAAVKTAGPRMKATDLPSLAAGIAFKIFLALFPSLVAVAAVFSLFGDPAAMVERLAGVLPEQALGLIEGQLTNLAATGTGGGLFALLAGVGGGIWAASSAAGTLIKGLNRVYAVEESRNFFKQRLIAISLILALLLTLAALVALVVLGPQLQRLVLPEDLFGGVGSFAFGLGQVVVAVVLLVLLFAFVYWVGPNRELPEWEWMTPGALIGVISWLVLSAAFTVYTQTTDQYAETYGFLAGAIVTMLWLQLSMAAVLVGGAVNAQKEALEVRAEHIQEGFGVGMLEPTTEPISAAPARPGLPAPSQQPSVRRGVLVAGLAATAAGLAALVGRRRGGA